MNYLGILIALITMAAMAVVGASCLWSIHELFKQEKRVQKGQFPENPKRKKELSRRWIHLSQINI